jgi:hypothetical protein
MPYIPLTAEVPVKSAAKSKIIWTQIIAGITALGSYFGFDLGPEDQTLIIGAIMAVQAALTVIFRKFANRSVTPSG